MWAPRFACMASGTAAKTILGPQRRRAGANLGVSREQPHIQPHPPLLGVLPCTAFSCREALVCLRCAQLTLARPANGHAHTVLLCILASLALVLLSAMRTAVAPVTQGLLGTVFFGMLVVLAAPLTRYSEIWKVHASAGMAQCMHTNCGHGGVR